MELIRYRNAVIYIKGKTDRQKLEEAAVRFYKKNACAEKEGRTSKWQH